ncbi:hypothetical protein MLGJGCBP_06716 [Rhodococcus sp. T7]|nr:hypothetical protein MLGJGCBP_09810 [Rhodococcus sp. T7]KAF0960137.1 hypothetical protein MLGJGCBP_06716 [Rhodococcus sp. T7]
MHWTDVTDAMNLLRAGGMPAAGDAGPEGMQRLLNFYSWDCEGLRDDVREVVVETIGDSDKGVLIVDETGF